MRTNRRESLLRSLWILATLPLAAACGDDDPADPSPTGCFVDSDCAEDEECVGEFGEEGVCTGIVAAVCGDGTLDEGEECDDGNTDGGDECEADCTLPRTPGGECGDGDLNDGEECDDGNDVEGDGCENDCTLTPEPDPFCGDGTVDEDLGEECDDGNTENGDGCENDCTQTPEGPYCGDGNVDEDLGEACDDGNTENGDGCENDCTETPEGPYCGDGNVDEGLGEECDDGNDVEGDGCENDCTDTPEDVCGDNVLGPTEDCDDGNTEDCDGCSSSCELDDCDPCGDGVLDAGEECDDGNNTSGDGCDADCREEPEPYDGWVTYVVTAPPTLERIAVVAGDGSLGPYTLPAGDIALSRAQYPTFSPDGTKLAYIVVDSRTRIRVYDLASGDFEEYYEGDFTAIRNPQFSPDGEQLAFSAQTAEVATWNIFVGPATGGEATALTSDTPEDTTTFFSSAAWSCDGTELIYLSGVPGPGGSNDLYAMNADGTGARTISAGVIGTSVVPSVNCTTAIVDSFLFSQPIMIDLATGSQTPFGIVGSDSNCAWYGRSEHVVCERESGPAPDFAACDGGGAECVRDIVVLDAAGEAVINLTESIDARENTPAATFQPYTEITVVDPS